jgi:CMP-N-acetylneuraminic acid synthetase
MLRTIALIPARGGSKRLPRKNLRPFAGQPLIYHSIALAHTIPGLERCLVSTEDAEIASAAQRFGAEVIDRPAALADDQATTANVALHALQVVAKQDRMPDVLLILQPTCPLRPKALVRRALAVMEQDTADCVLSVTEHRHKVGHIIADRFLPEYKPGIRSQDMPPRYFENGLVYATRAEALIATGSVFGASAVPLVTDPLYALADIDTAFDFELAELLFLRYRSHFEWPAELTSVPDVSFASAAGVTGRSFEGAPRQ